MLVGHLANGWHRGHGARKWPPIVQIKTGKVGSGSERFCQNHPPRPFRISAERFEEIKQDLQERFIAKPLRLRRDPFLKL